VTDGLGLGRVAGFPVRVHGSVFVILVLWAWGLAEAVLPRLEPGRSGVTYWTCGLAGAVVLLGSLLAHEVAHAVVARHEGVRVEHLTLWAFGGIATLRDPSPSARADFRIAAAGPLTSMALGAAFVCLAALLSVVHGDLLAGLAAWLGTVNFVLAAFNLLPGAPLDGGRVLRAALWAWRGDRDRAAITAAAVGEVFGWVVVAAGAALVLVGATVDGLWLVLVGSFLHWAARVEHTTTVTQTTLEGLLVRDVMTTPVTTGRADCDVADFVRHEVLEGRHSSYPVVDRAGELVGLVTLAGLRTVPAARRLTTSVREVALPLAEVPTGAPEEPLGTFVARLTPASGGRGLVLDGGRLVGIVTAADVSRVLAARQLLGRR
jgi:Zn-dependent protease/predicted transcriptional regulator